MTAIPEGSTVCLLHRLEDPEPAPPTAQQFGALQKMFDHFNGALFDGCLGQVMLNFSRHNPRTLGFFAPQRWEKGDEEPRLSEISLNPSNLKGRSPKDIASTLVHEMAHAWQHQHGCPSRGGYHNQEWASLMGSIGLVPSDTGRPGGRRVGQRMSHYILDGGPFERAFDDMPGHWFLPFVCGEPASRRRPSPKNRSKTRYTCPSCSAHAWGKPGLELLCGPCLAAAGIIDLFRTTSASVALVASDAPEAARHELAGSRLAARAA